MLKFNFTVIIFLSFSFFLRTPCVKESTLTAQTKLITVSASEWNGWTSKILHENETLLLDSPIPHILPAFPVTELHFPSAPCMTNHHCCELQWILIYHQEIYIYDLNILSYFKRVCLIEDGAEILSMNWMWSVNVDCANDDNLSTGFVLQYSVVCNNAFSQS